MTTSLDFLNQLQDVIRARRGVDPQSSYTASLLASGTRRIAQKVGEEAVEVAIAAVAGDRDELLAESADLLYHLLVLLEERDTGIADVIEVLEARHA